MYKQVEKQKISNSKVFSNEVVQKNSNVKQGFGFVDNRPEAVSQRKSLKNIDHFPNEKQIIQKLEMRENPPIREVHGQAVVNSVNRLIDGSLQWSGVAGDTLQDRIDNSYSHVQRVFGVTDIGLDIRGNAETDGMRHFVYEVGDFPAAMATTRDSPIEAFNDCLWLESLVTNPGAMQGGATLMEHVVNLSQHSGNAGKVVLAAYGDSAQTYQRFGFIVTEETYQEGDQEYPVYVLNPGDSDYWNFHDGIWKLSYFQENNMTHYLS